MYITHKTGPFSSMAPTDLTTDSWIGQFFTVPFGLATSGMNSSQSFLVVRRIASSLVHSVDESLLQTERQMILHHQCPSNSRWASSAIVGTAEAALLWSLKATSNSFFDLLHIISATLCNAIKTLMSVLIDLHNNLNSDLCMEHDWSWGTAVVFLFPIERHFF